MSCARDRQFRIQRSFHRATSSSGSHLVNREKHLQHRSGKQPMISIGESDRRILEVLMRAEPHTGHFIMAGLRKNME